LIAGAQSIPGVVAAAVTSALPFHLVAIDAFHIVGRTEPTRDAAPVADVALVSLAFFPVIGLRLVAGRWLTDADVTASTSTKGVAMASFSAAR
jgi:hypothetical protein